MGNAQGGPPPNPQGEEKKEDEPKKKVGFVVMRLSHCEEEAHEAL
jgi:hypothetical protein